MFVRVNDNVYPAEYLTQPKDIRKGMMGREHLDGCMVFKMGMGHHSFWMKDCLIPLDIVFVNKNTISRIHHNCLPHQGDGTPQSYTGIGDHVMEFPAGTCKDWKVGGRVNLYLGTPQNPVE